MTLTQPSHPTHTQFMPPSLIATQQTQPAPPTVTSLVASLSQPTADPTTRQKAMLFPLKIFIEN